MADRMARTASLKHALGAKMGHGAYRRPWEALQALLEQTAVMAKFSTVVSALMHDPKLADMMQERPKEMLLRSMLHEILDKRGGFRLQFTPT
jgi:hypothetical protein